MALLATNGERTKKNLSPLMAEEKAKKRRRSRRERFLRNFGPRFLDTFPIPHNNNMLPPSPLLNSSTFFWPKAFLPPLALPLSAAIAVGPSFRKILFSSSSSSRRHFSRTIGSRISRKSQKPPFEVNGRENGRYYRRIFLPFSVRELIEMPSSSLPPPRRSKLRRSSEKGRTKKCVVVGGGEKK